MILLSQIPTTNFILCQIPTTNFIFARIPITNFILGQIPTSQLLDQVTTFFGYNSCVSVYHFVSQINNG